MVNDDLDRGRKRIVKTELVTSMKESITMGVVGLLLETLQNEFGASVRTACKSLTENVGMNKVSARWVSRLLSTIEKDRLVVKDTMVSLTSSDCSG